MKVFLLTRSHLALPSRTRLTQPLSLCIVQRHIRKYWAVSTSCKRAFNSTWWPLWNSWGSFDEEKISSSCCMPVVTQFRNIIAATTRAKRRFQSNSGFAKYLKKNVYYKWKLMLHKLIYIYSLFSLLLVKVWHKIRDSRPSDSFP